MSASEISPLASGLHASIEQLIAKTVEQSQSGNDQRIQALEAALTSALAQIELSRETLTHAEETLKAALNGEVADAPVSEPQATEIEEVVVDATASIPTLPLDKPATPEEMDVIAHGVAMAQASGLQSLLRNRPEVTNAQTREFVNGVLRLHLQLADQLDVDALSIWLQSHGGTLTSQSNSVIEIRFDS